MSPAIRVAHLAKRFGGTQALGGVSLDIEPGEFFGLLGPNGAGKTTLISILAGLTRPDAGEASVMGHDVVRQYREARRALGVVPQELVYDPFFNVRETLRICDRAYIISDGRVLADGNPEELVNNDEVRAVYLGENFDY